MPGKPLAQRRPLAAGFFGKLPSSGDFVRRGLDAAVRGAVDKWLCSGARVAPAGWLESGQRPWRFLVGAGVLGPSRLGGVLGPSQDRVGRRFPLLLAAEVSTAKDGEQTGKAWYAQAETLLVGAVRGELDANELAQGVSKLPLLVAGSPASFNESATSMWWIGEDFAERLSFPGALTAEVLLTLSNRWTSPGMDGVVPCPASFPSDEKGRSL